MNNSNHKLILIGSSTGGPSLLEKIISSLPQELHVTIVLSQHMQRSPLVSFANRLNRLSKHEVILVKETTPIHPSKIYILSDSTKIVKDNNTYLFQMIQKDTFYHPCIDQLFASAAVFDGEIHAYILSGIGEDGVKGLKALQNKATRIAQDESTSAVYGMPRAAYEANVIESVMSIDEIVMDISLKAKV